MLLRIKSVSDRSGSHCCFFLLQWSTKIKWQYFRMIHNFLCSQASWPNILTDFKAVHYNYSVKILIRNSNIQIWVTYSTWLNHLLPKINSRELHFFLLHFLKVLQKSEVNQCACSYINVSFIRSIVKYHFILLWWNAGSWKDSILFI